MYFRKHAAWERLVMTWERFRSGHNRLSKWAPKEMADTCRSRLLLFQPVFAPMGQTPCKLRAQWASVSDGSNCLVFIPRHQQVSARNAVFWCLGKCPWSFYFTHYVCSICCSYLYIAFISWTISTGSCRLTIGEMNESSLKKNLVPAFAAAWTAVQPAADLYPGEEKKDGLCRATASTASLLWRHAGLRVPASNQTRQFSAHQQAVRARRVPHNHRCVFMLRETPLLHIRSTDHLN